MSLISRCLNTMASLAALIFSPIKDWIERPAPTRQDLPTAWRVGRRTYWVLGSFVLVLGTVWFSFHTAKVLGVAKGTNLTILWFLVFGGLLWHLALGWSEKTFLTTPEQQERLDRLIVHVAIPTYNEDPLALQRGLQALLQQTRLPQRIHVIENGPRDGSLDGVREWFLARASQYALLGLELLWDHIPEPGKRGAQIFAIKQSRSDIFVTMDSDTVADPKCIEEGIKPFADASIASVASVILAYNSKSRLVRVTDAWLLSFQLAVRAAMSRLGCVLVNSGNFALYRTDILHHNLDSYAAEFFRGNKVEFSDDSLLTLFSYLEGRTVQQPTSFAFTVLPEKFSHHLRQQLRWMRGSTIRSIWRFRYLPLWSWAYWEHFTAWVNFVLVTMAFVLLVVLAPFTGNVQLLPMMAGFAVLVAYMIALRYLTIRRSDQSVKSQLLTFALTPVMLAWTAIVLRSLRIYAIATCWKTGWGTRSTVEVELSGSSNTEASTTV